VFGIPADAGVCFNEDARGVVIPGTGLDLGALLDEDPPVLEPSRRQIAGQDAHCFKTRTPEGVITDICLSDDGVLLYSRAADGTELEATAVLGEPSDGDFEPPFEMRELPE
jgi:hypothetical protein